MSILSARKDGAGYFYGFAKPDMRQINVRLEQDSVGQSWIGYVGGLRVVSADSKEETERECIAWLKANPRTVDVED